ncbi:MAG: helix-turn-helix transcriptional regulator [Providencia heimbachae]|nr:helix-turn-helix transcriptional regulator [Providencia heimbachae]
MEKSEKSDNSQKQTITIDGIVCFKERLRQAMNGMTNVDLARMCGLSETAIRTYLKGRSLPTIDKAAAIASACNVNIEWLITGEFNKEIEQYIETSNVQNIDSPVTEIQRMLNNLNTNEVKIVQNYLNREGVNGLLRLISCNSTFIDNNSLEVIVNLLPLRPALKNAIKIGLTNNGEYDREILHVLEEIESRNPKVELKSKSMG